MMDPIVLKNSWSDMVAMLRADHVRGTVVVVDRDEERAFQVKRGQPLRRYKEDCDRFIVIHICGKSEREIYQIMEERLLQPVDGFPEEIELDGEEGELFAW